MELSDQNIKDFAFSSLSFSNGLEPTGTYRLFFDQEFFAEYQIFEQSQTSIVSGTPQSLHNLAISRVVRVQIPGQIIKLYWKPGSSFDQFNVHRGGTLWFRVQKPEPNELNFLINGKMFILQKTKILNPKISLFSTRNDLLMQARIVRSLKPRVIIHFFETNWEPDLLHTCMAISFLDLLVGA